MRKLWVFVVSCLLSVLMIGGGGGSGLPYIMGVALADDCIVSSAAPDQGSGGPGTIKECINNAGTLKQATIVLKHSSTGDTTNYVVGTALTIPSNFTLLVERGATLTTSVAVNIAAPIRAGPTQWVYGTGTTTITSYPQNGIWTGGSNVEVPSGALDASKPVFTDASKGLTSTGTVPVNQGGTGRATSTTAYGLIAAGTTATGAQQTLPAGATTEVLVGGGAAALPSWTTATGSGAPVRATSPTLAGIPLAPTATANTATTQIATTAFAKSEDAMTSNPKAMAQAVALTAAAAPGIFTAHSVTYSNTTNSFGYGGKFALPSWTPAAIQVLRNKWAANVGYKLEVVLTSGIFRLTLNSTVYDSAVPGGGAASNLVAGTAHEIIAVPTVGASTTTVSFYLDKVLLSTTAAQANVDVTNTQDSYTGGTSAARYAMTVYDIYNFNLAPTSTEIASLVNGIPESWKWGSQTSLVTGDNSTFASDTGFWTKDATVSIADGVAHFVNTSSGAPGLYTTSGPITLNKKYRLTYTISARTKGGITAKIGSTSFTTRTANGTYTEEIECTSFGTGKLLFYAESETSLDIDNVVIYEIGVTAAYESEGFQPAPGQCLDSSSNKNHAMQPATGSSLTRLKKDFEFRSTNTWTASSAAQYIGGFNRNVLTTKHMITSIVSRATVVTDVENITIGDGSSANYYVAAVAPTAAPIIHTLAANLNDGTNLKLVVTPAAEATMTVEFIVKGYLLE